MEDNLLIDYLPIWEKISDYLPFYFEPSDIKLLTNPKSKSKVRVHVRADNGVFINIRFSNHQHPRPQPLNPENVSNKQERGLKPKQKLSVYLNRVQICFWTQVQVWSLKLKFEFEVWRLKFEVWTWSVKFQFEVEAEV